jgi:hypothetical protein
MYNNDHASWLGTSMCIEPLDIEDTHGDINVADQWIWTLTIL